MSLRSKALVLVTTAFCSLSFAADPPVWTAELIFDNFEDVYGDPINRTCLGAIKSYSANNRKYTVGNFGYWYVFSGNDGTITTPGDQPLEKSNIASAFDSEAKCIYAKMSAVDKESYAAIAANLFNEGDWVNLSKMTSLSFKVKGTGSIRFYFKSKYYKNKAYTWGDIGYSVDLTAAWKTYDVKVADLAPSMYSVAEKDGVTWAMCKDSITSLAIEITNPEDGEKDPTTFYVDDIIFKGMKYCDIVDSNVTSIRYSRPVNALQNNFVISNNAISYTTDQSQNAVFSILDLNGVLIQRINGTSTAGSHQITLPALSTGNYLVKMEGTNVSRRLNIVK